MDTEIKVSMQFSRSTKGTHVYENNEDSAAISALYIKKSALPADPPKRIVVTVEEGVL